MTRKKVVVSKLGMGGRSIAMVVFIRDGEETVVRSHEMQDIVDQNGLVITQADNGSHHRSRSRHCDNT
jgi:hypothetical protein